MFGMSGRANRLSSQARTHQITSQIQEERWKEKHHGGLDTKAVSSPAHTEIR